MVVTRIRTYQAAWNPTEGTVTAIESIPAGISGPCGTYPATSREEAATVLFAAGYLVAGAWTVSGLGDHWIDLTRMA